MSTDLKELQSLGLTPEEIAIATSDDTPEPAPVEQEPVYEERRDPDVPLKAERPRDYEDRMAKADAAAEDAARLFDEGDIDTREYARRMRMVNDYRADARFAMEKADLARTMRDQAEEKQWASAVSEFLTQGPAASISGSPALLHGFDTVVRQVTASRPDLSDVAQLRLAWKTFQSEARSTGVDFDTARALGSMGSGGSSSSFAALDKLATSDPLAYEAAIANMSADEKERFLSSN